MKLQILFIVLIFLVCISCEEIREKGELKKVLKEYVAEVSIEDGDFIFVRELTYNSVKLFRIYASKNIEKDNLPSEYFKLGHNYVFIFDERRGKVPYRELVNDFKLNEASIENLYYNPEEWVILFCQSNIIILKDTYYAPMDSLSKNVDVLECY